VYYSSQWQQLEVRVGGTDSGDRRKHYMWGARYIDALIQRKRDTGADGSFDETHYALQDANFRVTAITDGSGSVVERYRYTSYGNRTVLNADWSTDSDSDSDVNMRSGQQGLYHDAVTGLIYNRNRMLHAQLGRFTTRDPRGTILARNMNFQHLRSRADGRRSNSTENNERSRYANGLNLYQYEASNPQKHFDPSGLMICLFCPDPPDPPDLDIRSLANRADVSQQIGRLWNQSNPHAGFNQHEEQAFWIVYNRHSQTVGISRWQSDGPGNAAIPPGRRPQRDGDVLVGHFHTHPWPRAHGGSPRPSQADRNFAQQVDLPGVIRSHQGLHFYGPDQNGPSSDWLFPPMLAQLVCGDDAI
jgi:RHS repeat-associated protein